MNPVARPNPDNMLAPWHRPFCRWILLLTLACVAGVEQASAYPLTQAQRDRLARYVPQALEKLERRQPIHVVVVGEGVSRMVTRDERSQDMLSSLHGHFLAGFEAEFYYTGGVRLVNPIGEHPSKNRSHKGEEITFEQFTEPEGTVLSALRQMSGRALLNPADLVLIHAGVNDSREGMLLETFGDALEKAATKALESGAEVIVVGPTLVHEPGSPTGWGGTRAYAAEARQVADKLGVMFLDPAVDLARTRPIPDDGSPGERAGQISEAIALDLFDYGPGVKETILMNPEAHRRAGRGMFQQFLNGLPESGWALRGRGNLVRPRELEVDVEVSNPTDRDKNGVLVALDIGSAWRATVPAFDLNCAPGETKTFKILYRQRIVSGEGEHAAYAAWQFPDGKLDCPLLISDLYNTTLLDLAGTLGPVKVEWDFSPQQGRRGNFPLKFSLHNPGKESVKGSYELACATQRARVNFELAPLQTKEFSNQCALPKDKDQWGAKNPVVLTVETPAGKFIEEREVEALRNQRLGETRPLAKAAELIDATGPLQSDGRISLMATVDADFLKVSFDLGTVELQTIPGKPSLLLELSLDGRPSGEGGSPGFVQPMQIGFSDGDGPGKVASISDAAFGEGYSKELSPRGVFAELKTGRDGRRKAEVSIPKIYLYRHDWKVDDPESRIGILTRVNFARRAPNGMSAYPAEARWMNAGAPLCREDASALPQLELSTGESNAWSVHLY